ncbi:RNA polymerase subunit sigma-70, partial [Escherichia coli]|nr:RNA polymerase subunit sigma-70 [Escherichia coli]
VIIDLYRRHALERAWLEMLSELPEALAPSPELRQSQLELLQQIDAILDRAYACLRKNKKIFIRCCPFSLTRSTYSLKPKTITEKL